ncbi:MAG TPA: carboxypeptidase-like regulatory domain-containing protein [Candidatus Acidoferrum sp.]|nr:carboxypeptidase-like regulatory domain-containing protein [Candidatus Acidoferrum sp.]
MNRWHLVFLLFAALAVVARAQDAGGMGTLAGTVLNAQGKPVAGASVTMQSATGGNPHATTTNSHGRFFFPDLVHGYYDVRAAHGNMASEWKHNIEVNTGKQKDVELRLTQVRKKPS